MDKGEACGWKAHVPQGRPLLFFRAVSRTARECEHMSYPTICFPTDVKVGMAGVGVGGRQPPVIFLVKLFFGRSLVLQ